MTFDDGTRDWSETVLPILVQHGVAATFYVATAFVEEQREFPREGRPISWSGLAEMVSTGLVTIGSHTHTHAMMDRLAAAEADEECRKSVGLIGDRLGTDCAHFAYPRAIRGGPAVEAVVRELFRSAVLAGGRTNRWSGSDVHRLTRTPVHGADSPAVVRDKSHGGLRLEGRMRAALDRIRYR